MSKYYSQNQSNHFHNINPLIKPSRKADSSASNHAAFCWPVWASGPSGGSPGCWPEK